MGHLSNQKRSVQPSEKIQQMSLDCAKLLASCAYDVGSNRVVVEVFGVDVDGQEKGDWRIVAERIG